jgi:hypothetical protein
MFDRTGSSGGRFGCMGGEADFSTAQRTMELSAASVEMTLWWEFLVDREAGSSAALWNDTHREVGARVKGRIGMNFSWISPG